MVCHCSHCLLCRVELCSHSGKVLRGFDLAECEGGPHDTRGMRRSTLLAALADALPSAAIRFDSAVEGVDDAGDHGTWCKRPNDLVNKVKGSQPEPFS